MEFETLSGRPTCATCLLSQRFYRFPFNSATTMVQDSGTAQILEQALRSNDDSLIDYMLTKTQPDQIPTLITTLQFPSLVPLIRAFTQHIQRFPESLSISIPWIEQLVLLRRNDIAASAEGRRRISDLQNVLKQRTQQMGIFVEVRALSQFVHQEKEGIGVGLPVIDTYTQTLSESDCP
jgi:hypothetical protein